MIYHELGYNRRDRLFSDYIELYKEYHGVSMSDLQIRRLLINNVTEENLEIRIKTLQMLLEVHD